MADVSWQKKGRCFGDRRFYKNKCYELGIANTQPIEDTNLVSPELLLEVYSTTCISMGSIVRYSTSHTLGDMFQIVGGVAIARHEFLDTDAGFESGVKNIHLSHT